MALTNGSNVSHVDGYTPPSQHPATKLRAMIEDADKIIVAPGVYDGFSARIALEVGFDCLYMVSSVCNLWEAKH